MITLPKLLVLTLAISVFLGFPFATNAAAAGAGLEKVKQAQSIIDRDTRGSVYLPGTTPYRLTQRKKTSLVTWKYAPKLEELQKKVFEAYRFPKAQSGGK
jgi:hypothetical protein